MAMFCPPGSAAQIQVMGDEQKLNQVDDMEEGKSFSSGEWFHRTIPYDQLPDKAQPFPAPLGPIKLPLSTAVAR